LDGLFRKYVQLGLEGTKIRRCIVAWAPMNQTWGIRKFYVTDVDGNTLRFGEPMPWEGATPVGR
jgi:hypothetical protein